MDSSFMAKKYRDAVKQNKIEASVLKKIPELVNCNDWSSVKIVGSVDYVPAMGNVHYDGVLLIYNNGLFYVKRHVVDALKNLDKKFKSAYPKIKVT